jgi:CRISPR/Cas system CSM-associated protein Csm4 (group 5 of RAMP superfamily)
MSWGLAGGYGRDAGVGFGRLDVLSVEPAELPTVPQPNAIMTLGTCVPAADDPTEGLWNIDVRHGRLGGAWARMTDPEDQSGVFKYPVVFLGRGAVFRTDQPRPIMGRLVRNVHPTRPEVVTCGYTLTLPVHLSEEAIPCLPTA